MPGTSGPVLPPTGLIVRQGGWTWRLRRGRRPASFPLSLTLVCKPAQRFLQPLELLLHPLEPLSQVARLLAPQVELGGTTTLQAGDDQRWRAFMRPRMPGGVLPCFFERSLNRLIHARQILAERLFVPLGEGDLNI